MSKLTKKLLWVYPAPAALIVVYLLFFAKLDFAVQAGSVIAVVLGFVLLLIANLLIK
jgi:hypothetical protein